MIRNIMLIKKSCEVTL